MDTPLSHSRSIIIAGAGIIGCSVAYQLCLRGYKPIIIDREPGVASGASGKAGGFLARKWNDRSVVGPMTRRSYDLHKQHAELFSDTMYRSMDTWSVSVHPKSTSKVLSASNLGWLDSGAVSGLSHLSDESDTAQVHPLLYTQAIFAECMSRGAKFVQAKIVSIEVSEDMLKGKVIVQCIDPNGKECEVAGDAVVVSMGCWSGEILKKFWKNQVLGAIQATSIVVESASKIPNVALFTDWFKPGEPNHYDPEVYPREDGTLYICACAEAVDIPEGGTSSVIANEDVASKIAEFAALLSPSLEQAPVLLKQACLLPVTTDDVPIIGSLVDNTVFVAAGHSCWGILNAPATGEALAQLIDLGHSDLDLSPFDPKRFMDDDS